MMETIQIEITNRCIRECSNCTRLVGHHRSPYFMDLDLVERAIWSLTDFPQMVGIMGGEPLLHPEFERISRMLAAKVPPERCGLWTCLPPGKEHHAQVICEVFGHLFLNDHTRDDILHAPILVASQEAVPNERDLWCLVDRCWVQNTWSACVNPHGAFFCEVAGALSMLLGGDGWEVEPFWWTRAPIHYVDQMERYCKLCGCALPLKKRYSIENIDDVSPGMLERLREVGSPKLRRGRCEIYSGGLVIDERKTATYKDINYRLGVAARYGMGLTLNAQGYMSPVLLRAA
jgi:hypothetical protein